MRTKQVLTPEEIIARFEKKRLKQAEYAKKYYDKYYKQVDELPEETQLYIAEKIMLRQEYQRERYEQNKERFREYGRMRYQKKKAEKEENINF